MMEFSREYHWEVLYRLRRICTSHIRGYQLTLIKEKTKFSSYIYKEIQMGSGAKSYSIWRRASYNIWGNAKIFSPYMRRSLVIYDFAHDPSEFPNTVGVSIMAHFAEKYCSEESKFLRTQRSYKVAVAFVFFVFVFSRHM